MTWKGTGRSGIGDQTIIGEYEDWCGLSMNGRQWKNPTTKETRDLSGADYWHQRKALEPKTPEDIPTFVNGKANVKGFAEPEKVQLKTKKSIADSIDLAERHYQRMERLSQELDEEYFAQELDEERYQLLRYKMNERLTKAWKRLEKDSGPIWEKMDEQEEIENLYLPQEINKDKQSINSFTSNVVCSNMVINNLSEGNIFKGLYLSCLKIWRVFR